MDKRERHESGSDIVVMHTDISRAYFHAPCKEEKYVELPREEHGRLRVSLFGTRDAAATWEDAYAKVQTVSSTVGLRVQADPGTS